MKTLKANWPSPAHIQGLTTTRDGGFSQGCYQGLNVGDHVGDDPAFVLANRQYLRESLSLPSEPIWLNQTHSTRCMMVDKDDQNRDADAAITQDQKRVLAIMTGDCLPILICNREGTEIAAIHAGWRGLMNGIVDTTLGQMDSDGHECMAWVGPAICGACYETGAEVLDAFTTHYAFAPQAFRKVDSQWYADLPKLAELIFKSQGLSDVYHANACTYESNNQFYSYRRASQTGRMVSLIWFMDNI